eukprot:TRINITY_DN1831_c0_g1_i2.p1 TRINITY_DN1831_c0_g1~~TRINITY_DN1831_c0_g1_i2.p1  ORF type:complete len:829 (+),score=145.86 TRINITY_DN1831_c0_g1_i2:234-2720(+)
MAKFTALSKRSLNKAKSLRVEVYHTNLEETTGNNWSSFNSKRDTVQSFANQVKQKVAESAGSIGRVGFRSLSTMQSINKSIRSQAQDEFCGVRVLPVIPTTAMVHAENARLVEEGKVYILDEKKINGLKVGIASSMASVVEFLLRRIEQDNRVTPHEEVIRAKNPNYPRSFATSEPTTPFFFENLPSAVLAQILKYLSVFDLASAVRTNRAIYKSYCEYSDDILVTITFSRTPPIETANDGVPDIPGVYGYFWQDGTTPVSDQSRSVGLFYLVDTFGLLFSGYRSPTVKIYDLFGGVHSVEKIASERNALFNELYGTTFLWKNRKFRILGLLNNGDHELVNMDIGAQPCGNECGCGFCFLPRSLYEAFPFHGHLRTLDSALLAFSDWKADYNQKKAAVELLRCATGTEKIMTHMNQIYGNQTRFPPLLINATFPSSFVVPVHPMMHNVGHVSTDVIKLAKKLLFIYNTSKPKSSAQKEYEQKMAAFVGKSEFRNIASKRLEIDKFLEVTEGMISLNHQSLVRACAECNSTVYKSTRLTPVDVIRHGGRALGMFFMAADLSPSFQMNNYWHDFVDHTMFSLRDLAARGLIVRSHIEELGENYLFNFKQYERTMSNHRDNQINGNSAYIFQKSQTVGRPDKNARLFNEVTYMHFELRPCLFTTSYRANALCAFLDRVRNFPYLSRHVQISLADKSVRFLCGVGSDAVDIMCTCGKHTIPSSQHVSLSTVNKTADLFLNIVNEILGKTTPQPLHQQAFKILSLWLQNPFAKKPPRIYTSPLMQAALKLGSSEEKADGDEEGEETTAPSVAPTKPAKTRAAPAKGKPAKKKK